MQIEDKHWDICLKCDNCQDDDEALYCDKQKECSKINLKNSDEAGD